MTRCLALIRYKWDGRVWGVQLEGEPLFRASYCGMVSYVWPWPLCALFQHCFLATKYVTRDPEERDPAGELMSCVASNNVLMIILVSINNR